MPTTRSCTNSKTKDGCTSFPPKSPDGHHIIVNNRKWRATDPSIPTEVLTELKHYLAKGRSGVRKTQSGKVGREKINISRQTTALAKLGLGERGKPEWWNDTPSNRQKRWESALESLRELHTS
ncbi:hypothetical protein QBC43DRAFT_323094 [Cladorrhinum sp. PSN259]|nr:hypothetical protein QBC43DRAFT_323094 [Cladorrhinum sp. PSN259]